MIPKNHRFNMRANFLKFKRSASRLHSSHIIIYYADSPDPLLAVVVPKKVNLKATTRNIFKRKLKQLLISFTQDKPMSLVLILKPIHADKAGAKDLELELKDLLAQIK